MALSGRKRVNPLPHPESLIIFVKIPVLHMSAIPKGPPNAKRLNEIRLNVGPPVFISNTESVKKFLQSKQVKSQKEFLRKKGLRGIIFKQSSFGPIVVICPRCKEIGSPVIEWSEKYLDVKERTRLIWENDDKQKDRELILWYNHMPGSTSERCRICKIVAIHGGFASKPFKNSKIDLKDLMMGRVVSHIINQDKGYEKYSKIFNVC